MSLKQLPVSTVKLITSSQIITSVTSAVKELVENALDAGASNIDVKLEHNGLDLIEVKDDGCGINRADTSNMCLSHYTSKINDFADLDKLQSYGFRGEALNALCSVADVTITTRTSEDEVAMTYTLNMNGNVVKTKPSHFGKGTLVSAKHLFRNLPVRKQYLSSGRRAAEELKRAENVVKSLAVIHPDLRLTFCHNKNLLWQKSSCTTLQQSLMQVVGHSVSSKLEVLGHQEMELTLDIMVPKKELENLTSLCISYTDCMMMYINHRPVRYKKLEKLLLKYIGKCFPGQLRAHKYPYCLVSIVTSPGETDVNLEPNKTKVLLKEEVCNIQMIFSLDKNPRPVLIGQLKPSGTWLYHKDKELGIVRHWALQEVVHYHRLMMDHSIPLKKLESSIQFDESTLGAELWKVLLSQSKTYDVITSAVIITSDAISKNGFRIELVEGLGKTFCVLTDIASTINFYGINDLKNTLELIKTHGSSSLMKCRSLSVVNYIKGETVRIVRQCPSKMEKETLQDLIHYWHLNLSHLEASCLHGKPIFHAIKYLSEL
ncbi:hypothetical protein ANN_02706 [Periplaneta americana]|uniref:DNA mismatch repair protein S5 domain-containing protein n=1 Tax=Periplaneta americana TaxID=6978 RepID=A0ABQ8U1H5_PERAM|nr:hypothetical protein ANN_02706 [Periplaneta americana]